METTYIQSLLKEFQVITLAEMEKVRLMNRIDTKYTTHTIGFALGIFAIFGIIRYRTESVPIREMTYLFIIIAISVINGLSVQISKNGKTRT